MKKFAALLMTLVLMISCCAMAETAPESVQVYVSVTNDAGELALAYHAVTVTDVNADGVLSIDDALSCAHAQFHEEGAAAYVSAETEYGISMMKLWGVDNGGSYGYYLNDQSAWSLLDPVAENDHVKAYAYTDLETWSDTYCFFEAPAVTVKAGEAVSFKLQCAAYDENWAPITLPVAAATLTVNGENTEIVTDEAGAAAVTFDAEGTYLISAYSETATLVAPVCIVTVTAE